MPAASDLPYLIRLLDDSDPAVRPAVRDRLASYQGDISHDLAALGMMISATGKKRLSQWLEPGRRQTLMDEWIVPTQGGVILSDDWDGFENLLLLLADFLHDGITLRPSLPDELDLLIDEIREDLPHPTPDELRRWLFVKGPFKRTPKNADDVNHFDLCHVIDHREGNATSLGCLFMLLGRRMGIVVEGCNYPGHFLTRIDTGDGTYLVDCFHGGRKFDVEELLGGQQKISDKALSAIEAPCYLGDVLLRYLREMQYSLTAVGRVEDAELLKQLASTLIP